MSGDEILQKAKERIRKLAGKGSLRNAKRLSGPDDQEIGDVGHAKSAETLVAIDSPDDQYIHHPETLGVKGRRSERPQKDK